MRGTAIDRELLDDGHKLNCGSPAERLVPKQCCTRHVNVDVNVKEIIDVNVYVVVSVHVYMTVCVNVQVNIQIHVIEIVNVNANVNVKVMSIKM